MYNMVMIRALIFDCFGVILSDALSVLVGELETTEPEKVREMRSLVHSANRGIIAPEISTAHIAELLGVSVEAYRARIQDGEVRDQKLLNFIKTLRADYKTAMLSNITKQGIERRFPNNELAHYFDTVVVSSEIGYAKPDREAYLLVAAQLGVQPTECLFTDDRSDYCEAARDVGMQAITYENFPQFKRALTEVLDEA